MHQGRSNKQHVAHISKKIRMSPCIFYFRPERKSNMPGIWWSLIFPTGWCQVGSGIDVANEKSWRRWVISRSFSCCIFFSLVGSKKKQFHSLKPCPFFCSAVPGSSAPKESTCASEGIPMGAFGLRKGNWGKTSKRWKNWGRLPLKNETLQKTQRKLDEKQFQKVRVQFCHWN